MFCAPTLTLVAFNLSFTCRTAVNGGMTKRCTRSSRASSAAARPSAKAIASTSVLFIFQLVPTQSPDLLMPDGLKRKARLLVGGEKRVIAACELCIRGFCRPMVRPHPFVNAIGHGLKKSVEVDAQTVLPARSAAVRYTPSTAPSRLKYLSWGIYRPGRI